MEYRRLDQPETVDIEQAFENLQKAKQLVIYAEKKLYIISDDRHPYYVTFGKTTEQRELIEFQLSVFNRCKEIKSKCLEIYYAAEKEF